MITLTQFISLFNILAGLMLTISILLFGAGLIMWFARLGTGFTYRDEAIKIMGWGVYVLFTLELLLVVVKFVQEHLDRAVYVIGLAILALIAWALIFAIREARAAGEEH